MLTNQFTGAWTHYTDTVQGIRIDHMVGSFQRILIEYAHSSINHTIYIGIRVRQQNIVVAALTCAAVNLVELCVVGVGLAILLIE